MRDHGLGQYVDYLAAIDPAPHVDRQALPCVLIDQVQEAYCSAVVREATDEIVGPDMIAPLRPQAHAGTVVEPQTATWFLFLRYLQTFAAPDPFYAILAHIPARFLQLDGDASISIPAILASQHYDGPGQRVLVVPLCELVALRAAWLVNQLARMTLTRPLLPGVFYSGTAPLRA